MSFTNDVENGFFFSQMSNASLYRAGVNFSNCLCRIASPYYDLTSNVKAIGHPFFHATQLLRDAGRFIYGAFVLVGALVTGHFFSTGLVAICMLQLILAAALEIINIALSIVSLATRFVASLFNFGYVLTRAQFCGEETILNFLQACDASISEMSDEMGHQAAFILI